MSITSAVATASDISSAGSLAPLAMTGGALATMPAWLPYLRQSSEIAADLAPLVGVLIGIVTLYRAATASNSAATVNRQKKTFRAKLKTLASELTAKGGPVALIAIVVLGLLAVASIFVRPRADVVPLAIMASPPATSTRRKSKDAAGDDGEADLLEYDGAPPWFVALAALKGQHEGTARKPNPVIAELFKAGGFERFKDQSGIAWCSIGLCGIFERLGIPSAKTTMARNWLKWGAKLATPRVGCVMVLARGNDGISGHVGLYAGETPTHYLILGCNQSDSITVGRFPKRTARVLGYRWPREIHELKTVKAGVAAAVGGVGGVVSTGVVIADSLQQVQGPLANIGTPHALSLAAYIGLGCALLSLAGALYAVYFRTRDFKTDGL